jgi:Protein of unknown function DUF262
VGTCPPDGAVRAWSEHGAPAPRAAASTKKRKSSRSHEETARGDRSRLLVVQAGYSRSEESRIRLRSALGELRKGNGVMSSLEEQIASKAQEIHTDGYPMSIGEVLSLYRDGDIDIHPEFQRIFRWTLDQKSRLIESVLLGIPIPPIFVSQRSDGVWDVIDGVQRLSTILEFVGLYRDQDKQLLAPTTLRRTEYLPALDGYRYEVSGPSGNVFSDSMRRDFKRAKLEFRIIEKESDPNAKYDMFQRLNSGTELSPQEARNCLLVMLHSAMFEEISKLANSVQFTNAVPISDQKENESYRQELVLRFFCQADYQGGDSQLDEEYGEYLTKWMRSVAPSFGTKSSKIDSHLFERTFSLIERALGEDAFKRFDGKRHLGPFSSACYEFVTAGVAANIDAWERATKDQLAQRVQAVWTAPEFRANSGTGVSPRRRVPRLVNLARAFFAVES